MYLTKFSFLMISVPFLYNNNNNNNNNNNKTLNI